MTSEVVRLLLKLAFGLAVLGLIVWVVDVGQTIEILGRIDPVWLLLASLAYLATRGLMGVKWWVLLGGREGGVSLATVQRAILLSDYHGLLFPNTLAIDALRAVLLRHHPRGLAFTAASIAADRLINLGVAAAIALLALAVTRVVQPILAPAASLAVLLIAGAVLFATLAVASERLFALAAAALRLVAQPLGLSAGVARLLAKLGQMHKAMRAMLTDPLIMRRAVLLALVLVLVRGLWIFCLFQAIGVAVGPLWIITLMPVITMISLLPVTVLGLGLKDGAFVFFFGAIGVAAPAALGVSLSSYAIIICCSVVVGLLATLIGPPLPRARTDKP